MILDFQNNGAVVLTTQEPGAFLNFRWETGDGSIYINANPNADVSRGILWVNGLDISQEASIYGDPSINTELYLGNAGDPSVASLFLYTRELGPFDANLNINYEQFDQVVQISGITSWDDSSWTGGATIFGDDIANSESGLPGDYIESNYFSVNGGNLLEGSIAYSQQGSPFSPYASCIVYQTGPGVDISTLYDPSIGGGSFSDIAISISLDPSTTSVYVRWYAHPDPSTRFGATNPIFLETGHFSYSVDVSVLNRPYIVSSESINTFDTANVQVEGEASYLLMRTNPKFSGNIKLTIDPSNLLYLDTFKVSDILTNKLYRKQKISANSVFSGDIRRVFSSMPLGEMYRLDAEDTLDIAIPKTDLFDQYNVNYTYGSRLFVDELYEEDYAMLAPLWINNKLPDYFAIFRMPGVINEETYPPTGQAEDLTGLADKFLKQGELMESWGIKEGAPLGTYLRNHLKELYQVISPMFLSLSDPNLKDPDPNTWYGIAIDKGIITGRSETTYFFDQKASNFTDLNAFCSQGFERLNLLCPNLINMEYAFNDPDVSLYTMQRYFGLYLTENPLYQISYYADSPDASIRIISLDGKDSQDFFSSVIFDTEGNIKDEYNNRLFTLDDVLSIKRITNVHEVDGTNKSDIEEWLNKPGQNIFSVKVKEISNFPAFITIGISNLLNQGEHLRIVDNTDFSIWEVIGTETDLLEAGQSWTYATEYPEDGYPRVYRTLFSTKGSKSDQNTAIWNAWNVFLDYPNTPFRTFSKKDESHSLVIEDWASSHDIKFQRLTAQTTSHVFDSMGAYDPSSSFNSAAGYGDITFYGTLIPSESDFERLKYDSSFGPINFELFGDRMSITIDIFNPSGYSFYSLDSSIVSVFEDNMLYLSPDGWYRLVQNFDVSTAQNHSLQYIEDPQGNIGKIGIITEYPIVTINGYWNSYAVYPLIISLMGINPVKDFDFTVYDSITDDPSAGVEMDFQSSYWYKREGDASTFRFAIPADSSITVKCSNAYDIIGGSGTITIGGDTSAYSVSSPSSPFKFNTFDSSAKIQAATTTIVTYAVLDGSASFKSYKTGYSEEELADYYQDYDPCVGFYGTKELKYGLTVPTVVKWVGTGNDCRNNPLRLIFDPSILDVSTNFIPTANSLSDEIFYPSFKYLTAGTRNWEDYVFYDINDTLMYEENGNTFYSTFKEFMIENPYSDVFSKLVYSNNNVDGTKLRSSIAYYNNYKNTIDVILNGLSLSFRIVESARNILDIQDWNRFKVSGIAVPSRNRDNNKPIEVFINENTQTILIVWYQGNDILNYTYRNSTALPGKGVLDPDESVIKPIQWRGFDHTSRYYSHVKTPFGVNNASLSSNIFNIYGTGSYSGDTSTASPFNQINLNFGDNLFSVFNAFSENEVIGSAFEFFGKSYDTFRQYVSYSYLKQSGTYGALVANLAYSYMKNTNLYQDDTCNWSTLNSLLSSNRVQYYIFRADSLFTSSSFSVNPVTISINPPREYNGIYTYSGWYRPKFNNILEFSSTEDREIADIVEKDFIFGNTNLKSYNNIPQLWYNKVVNNVTSFDVSIGNAIGYVDSWNPFKSQWDSRYYYLYSGLAKSDIDGYNSTLELPSYFGSKLIKLPESLALDSWENTTADEEYYPGRLSMSYNLTRTIVNIFKDNDTFIDNWSDLSQADNVIDGYIKKTILSYYNISKPKIRVEIWRKEYKGEPSRIAYSLDDTFTKWDAANVDGNLAYVNNEYIYTINVVISPAFIYYVKFTLFEK